MSWYRRPMEHYNGRHIGCAPGTHLKLFNLAESFKPAKDGGVIDLGGHSGALLERFRDGGYSNLMLADLDETRYQGISFAKVDLNGDFPNEIFKVSPRRYALVTATDVIEHLDSPREFLTKARKLVTDDGYIALSLPNIGCIQGRIKFVLKAELWGFGAKNYILQRHISPVTKEQMELLMREIGWQLVACTAAGSFFRPWIQALLWPIRRYWPWLIGESAIYIARKVEPDSSLRVGEHYKDRWEGRPDNIGIDVTERVDAV